MAPEIRPIWETYRLYFCAVGGALIGGLSVFIVMTGFDGWLPAKHSQTAQVASSFVTSTGRGLEQAELLIGILEEIAAEESEGRSGTLSSSSEYQKCLGDCDRDFGDMKQSSKAVLINCRKECIALYAEHVREIRKRYHGDGGRDRGKGMEP